MRDITLSVPIDLSAPGRRLSSYEGTDSHDPRICPNLPNGQDLDTKAPFLLTVNGRFLFGATEKKTGVQLPVPRRGTLIYLT